MKRPVGAEYASASIDQRIKELGEWRGKMLAKVREIKNEADPEILEEWKWMGTPVWSHCGIVCTGETYKNHVKMTFAKGAELKDPSGLFNSSLDGNVRRARPRAAGFFPCLRAPIRVLCAQGQEQAKAPRASSKRAD